MNRSFKLEATGEAVTIVKDASATKGEYVEFVVTLPAGAPGPPPHIHPLQEEYFEVLEGKLGLMVNGRKIVLGSGESYELPRNTIHTFYNGGETSFKIRTIFRPALHMDWLSAEMIASANRNNSKFRSLLETAYILSKAKGEYKLTGGAGRLQKIAFPFFALLARITGVARRVGQKGQI